MSGIDLLVDDLVAADRYRLLPAAATAGAQIRSTGEQLADLGELDPPRSLIVLADRGEATLVAGLPQVGVRAPVISVPALPRWTGPLDVVVVASGAPDDTELAEQVAVAVRRGATVLVRTPADGVPAQAGGTVLPPAVGVPEALAGPARFAMLTAVAHRCGLAPDPRLDEQADRADAVSIRCRPSAESVMNPALVLADAIGLDTPVIVGADATGDALAAILGRVLQDVAGVAASTLPHRSVLLDSALLRRPAVAVDDIFADPTPGNEHRWIVSAGNPNGRLARALTERLPRLLTFVGDESSASESLDASATGRSAAALTLAGFICVYLSLLVGTVPPPDGPHGLAR